MGGRKQKKRKIKPGIHIIGEGITEQYYFSHIKRLLGLNCIVKPHFFGNTCIGKMEKKIEELIRDDIHVICVFDCDVSVRNKKEWERLNRLMNLYKNDENVIFCDSLPSIEYWFLLHYENTNRSFKDAKAVEDVLKKYIPDYEKTTQFLEKEKWVCDLCADEKFDLAMKRAQSFSSDSGSYTNIYKAFLFFKENQK
jgi:hypothetical protein